MPSINNQALLLNLEVYLANNNIRKGILNVVANASAPGNQCVEQSFDVGVNSSLNYTSILNNSCTVIRTTKPVTVILTRGLQTFTFVINSLFVYSDAIDSFTFTNASLVDVATIRLVQI